MASAEVMPSRARAALKACLFEPGAAGPASFDADFDCCRLDGAEIRSAREFESAIACGRLANIAGAFAFARVDNSASLTLGRDAVGERTLFYAETPRGLAYGASIHDLIGAGLVEPRLNLRAVAKYLAYAYLPGRETLVEGVCEVLAGEEVRYGPRGLERSFYWQLPSGPPSAAGEAELAAELRGLLERATRRLLPPPGESAGAFLSGGLDFEPRRRARQAAARGSAAYLLGLVRGRVRQRAALQLARRQPLPDEAQDRRAIAIGRARQPR